MTDIKKEMMALIFAEDNEFVKSHWS